VGADVVFLIDNTGSMEDDIDSVKASVTTILESLPQNTRVGLATYGDNNLDPNGWYSYTDLTDDHDVIKTKVNQIELSGGGPDWLESVYDGLWETMVKMSWFSSTQRLIIVLGDAPPLTDDDTNHSLDDVIEKSEETFPAINVFLVMIEGGE
jgi:hypothetical protein